MERPHGFGGAASYEKFAWPLRFWAANLALTAIPASLKTAVPPLPDESDAHVKRGAKWANFVERSSSTLGLCLLPRCTDSKYDYDLYCDIYGESME